MTTFRGHERLQEALADFDRLVAAAREVQPGRRPRLSPRAAVDALRNDLVRRKARLADGSVVRTRAQALRWLAEGVEAARAGEPRFDLDAPEGTRWLLYSGEVIDPRTNEPVPIDPSQPATPSNVLHSGAIARAVSRALPAVITLE